MTLAVMFTVTCGFAFPVELPSELMHEYVQSGGEYLVRMYDTNGDGKMDLETARKSMVYKWSEHPQWYKVDWDYDGHPDLKILDYGMARQCRDLYVFH